MRPRLLAGVLATALAVAGCLPSTVAPTPPPTAAPTATATPAPTPSPTPAPPTPTPAPTFVLHTVVVGDNLTSIARRYETTGRSLAYWNRDAYPSLDPESSDYEPDRLQVGWVLRVMPGTEYVPPEDEGPTPTPGPVASLVIPPGPTPAAGTSMVVSNGGRGGNAVALTFDMGGDLEPDAAVATWLVEHDVPATIFPTGLVATTSADGRAVVALAAAHPDVLTLGNGGWDGRDMTTLGAAGVTDQLTRADDALAAATGRSTRPLFRPPDGAQDRAVRDAAGAGGWPYTVLWDVDTLDGRLETDGGPSAGDIVAKVLSRAQGGSIVLLHIGGEHTLEALPEIVDGLRSRGLEPVTLHRLLGVEPGG